jgi:glycosyltransferase involved in cell wall biosynthesis
MPAVSVVMPVYNAERYVRDAVDSILAQSFRYFELLIIDDGSRDDTPAILESYTDPRIKVIRNEINRGLVYTANRCLDESTGDYIAIMHADDVALPHRLAAQVAYLKRHPQVGIVGSWYETFGNSSAVARPYTDHEHIAAALLFNSALGHPTVMYRKEILRLFEARYARDQFPIEDWEMWVRMAGVTRLANLPSILLRYRVHTTSVTGTHGAKFGSESPTIKTAKPLYTQLLARLGVVATAEELDIHTRIGHGFPFEDGNAIRRAESWLRQLIAANRRARVYSEPAFSEVVGSHWSAISYGFGGALVERAVRWVQSPLLRHALRGAVANQLRRAWPWPRQ